MGKNSRLNPGLVSTAEGIASLSAMKNQHWQECGGLSSEFSIPAYSLGIKGELEQRFPLRGNGCVYLQHRQDISQLFLSPTNWESCLQASFSNARAEV